MYILLIISVTYLGIASFGQHVAPAPPTDGDSDCNEYDGNDDAAEWNDDLYALVERRLIGNHDMVWHVGRCQGGGVMPRRLELEVTIN